MEDKQEQVELILNAISQLYTYSRFIVHLDNGKMDACNFSISMSKKEDSDDIVISGHAGDKEPQSVTISVNDMAEMLQRSQNEGVSPNNMTALEQYMASFFKNLFISSYGNEAITLSNMIKNSNVVILDAEEKPLMILGNTMHDSISFLEFSDFLSEAEVEYANDSSPHFILNFDYLDKMQKYFSLYEDTEEKLSGQDSLILLTMNQDIKNRIFKVTLKKVAEMANCYVIDKIKVIKRDPMINIMKNDYDNLQKIFMEIIAEKNTSSVDLLSMID